MPREFYQLPTMDDLAEMNRILDSISRRLNFLYDYGEDTAIASKKITGLATGVDDPDAVRKDQIGTVSSTFIASRLVSTNASFELETVADLTDWILASGLITATDNGDGTVTISSGLYTINVHTTNQTLTTADFRQVHLFNSALNLKCTLPATGAGDVGDWVIIGKISTGDLQIKANAADTMIATGGSTLLCNDNTWIYQRMGLRLWQANFWGSGPECYGKWEVH